MKILIFEDIKNDAVNLINCIKRFFANKDIKFELTISKNYDEILNKAEISDLIFLDIEVGNSSGIDLGIKIKNTYSDPKIIITSQYTKYLIDGYKVHAERYFIKPIEYETFEMEMENVISNYYKQQMCITDSSISDTKIYFKDILYIEFIDRKTTLHLINGKNINTTYPLKHWIDELKENYFSQPHRAFVVNLIHISSIAYNEVILINEEKIPLSRHYKTEFRNKYLESIHQTI